MDWIFVEARGRDGTNLCLIERPRNFLGSLLVSGSKRVNYEFCRRGVPVSTKREQTLELNTCVRTVAPKEEDENQDTCAVFFPVAR